MLGLFFMVGFLPVKATAAQTGGLAPSTETLNAYFFYGDGCPHCAEEEEFLFGSLSEEYPNLKIYTYEIYNNRANALLLQKIGKELDARVDGVPFLTIGDEAFIGYANGMTSVAIEKRVAECSTSICPDLVAALAGVNSGIVEEEPVVAPVAPDEPAVITEPTRPVEPINSSDPAESDESSQTAIDLTEADVMTLAPSAADETSKKVEQEKKIIKLPLLGEVDALSFSLPLLTVAMGVLDGFNPCAMWALLFLISLLLGMKDRKRMWILGIAFIVASAAVYFLFMAAWLNLILFLGFIFWVRILIGLLALGGGGYSLKEFFTNKDAACKVGDEERKHRTMERLKLAVHQNSFWLALGGIIILAFVVNLVELVCSAGLPAVYTQVLVLSDMPTWRYYLYISGYIFFFMLDDLLIFLVAMITLEITGVTTKYVRAARLVGGLLMLLIGLLLIFKPAWLMFG